MSIHEFAARAKHRNNIDKKLGKLRVYIHPAIVYTDSALASERDSLLLICPFLVLSIPPSCALPQSPGKMVIKTLTCNFSHAKIYPGHGKTFVRMDSKVISAPHAQQHGPAGSALRLRCFRARRLPR